MFKAKGNNYFNKFMIKVASRQGLRLSFCSRPTGSGFEGLYEEGYPS